MANIFKNLITNEERYLLLHKEPGDNLIEETKNIVNTQNLDLINDDDLIHLMKILNYAMRVNLLDAITKKVSPECARISFIREVEILKKGISK